MEKAGGRTLDWERKSWGKMTKEQNRKKKKIPLELCSPPQMSATEGLMEKNRLYGNCSTTRCTNRKSETEVES